MKFPRLLYAKDNGEIFDAPGLAMAGMSGGHAVRIPAEDLIELPPGSDLFMLPGRSPLGLDEKTGRFEELPEFHAVAAFVAPAYTLRATTAYRRRPGSEAIPLNAYGAVGFLDGRYFVPAFRVDPDPRQDIEWLDQAAMDRNFREDEAKFPGNRALAQMKKCAFEYGCPAARNYFHRRWEAPMPTSMGCNARCVGCISLQPKDAPPSPMNRLTGVPLSEEIAALMVPHIERAERPVLSFGQGCEGEPLTNPKLLEETIRAIRARTDRGTLNLNTNASRPGAVEALAKAGLDSMRVSLNSARKGLYEAYYKPTDYKFEDVVESVRRARKGGVFVSLNYFVFPGITDQEEEMVALLNLLRESDPNYIQMRNLNMDPDLYLETVGKPAGPGVGVDRVLELVHREFPKVRFGYFNPPREWWGKSGTTPPEHRKLSKTHDRDRKRQALSGLAIQGSAE